MLKTALYFSDRPTDRIAEQSDALRLCHARDLPVCSGIFMLINFHPFRAACCRAERMFYI